MSHRTLFSLAFVLVCLGTAVSRAESPTPAVAISRGLEFLQADAVKWRQDRECATCHHGTMTIWVQSEARSQGYDIAKEHFDENLKWTKDRLYAKLDQPRDTRPGHSMINSSALNLAVMAWCIPNQHALSAEEIERIICHLLRHQEADGSWAWSSAPAVNRPPPFFESDEVATLLGCAALHHGRIDGKRENPEIREAREKADSWLAKTSPTKTTQSAAYKLLVTIQSQDTADNRRKQIEELLARQNNDGGWGQLRDIPSDAYATGQVLYILSLSQVPKDNPAVQRGVKFLVETQREDGSWPMNRRGHPGVTPSDFKIPIIYFGSAWGTLGLLRSVEK